MKKMMKILTVLFALTCAIMPVVGCYGDGVEKNKTQLYIGNYNQGFGQAWLDAAAKRFEEQYADVSFEKGKTGVQVVIEDVEVSNNLYQSIKNSRSEVIFNEMADYFQWAKSGKVLDITDIVSGENASLEKYGDAAGVTIESKMYDSAIDYYRYNNKYYGVPFYETYIGIMYDIDMWAERGYYIKDNAGGKFTWTKNVAEAWAGQDGEKGTSDDGLPITYDDFYALCARIKDSGEIAIAWSGKSNTGYSSALLDALHADYEGREQMSLNYTLEGTATNVVDKIANGEVTVKTVEGVTAQTGYNLYRQAGRYYALNFFEHIMDGGYYSDKIFNKQTVTHLDAQNFFVIKNKFGGTSIRQDVAMLIEGTWWYNEAAGAFKSIENRGGGQHDRNFGVLPMPKATAEKAAADKGKQTLYDPKQSVCFVNAKTPEFKQSLAKEFIKFVHSDESLVEFTEIVSALKPYKYNVSDEKLAAMTPFARNLLKNRENSEMVYPYSHSTLFNNKRTDFLGSPNWSTKIGNDAYNHPTTALLDGISAEDYFNGLQYADPKVWKTTFERYW